MEKDNKKSVKKYIFFGLVIFVLGFLSFLLLGWVFGAMEKVSFHFYINETNNPLNGKMYLDETYLGNLSDGYIKIKLNDLHSGEVKLSGVSGTIPFNFYWQLTNVDIDSRNISFYLISSQLEDIRASKEGLNVQKEKDNLLRLFNEYFSTNNFMKVKNDVRLESLAEDIMNEVISSNISFETYFNNGNLENKLGARNIFFTNQMAFWNSELLHINSSFSEDVFDYWINSESTTNTLEKSFFSNLGTSIYCYNTNEENPNTNCIILTIITANGLIFKDWEGQSKYVYGVDIYDYLSKQVRGTYNVSIVFNSTKNSDILLVKNYSDYKKYLQRDSVDEVFKVNTRSLDKSFSIKPDYTIIINPKDDDIVYDLSVKENYP
jgi:hypothetical protein